ncbi:MAG: L,D-transpeptidase [Rhizobiaceae bacterium]|nr:L,D-transpeptidase [Rhizobiaceae bacterium]
MRRWLVSVLLALAIGGGSTVSDALARAAIVARVDISAQTMTVSRNGRVIDRWKVSTAGKGYRTPVGSYRPTRMHRMWYSRKYDDAPMPHSIFFHGGYAIHGTDSIKRLGRPASHGCIRLHPSNAAALYAMVREVGPRNTSIVITR